MLNAALNACILLIFQIQYVYNKFDLWKNPAVCTLHIPRILNRAGLNGTRARGNFYWRAPMT